MSKRIFAALFGVLAVSVVAAGCGGGGGSTTSSLTKAEFIKQADAICTKGNERSEAGIESFIEENGLSEQNEPTEAQREELVTDVVLPSIQQQAEEIDELGAPGGDEETIEEIVKGVEEGVAEAEAEPGLILSGPSPFTEVDKKAQAYGLKVCGQGQGG